MTTSDCVFVDVVIAVPAPASNHFWRERRRRNLDIADRPEGPDKLKTEEGRRGTARCSAVGVRRPFLPTWWGPSRRGGAGGPCADTLRATRLLNSDLHNN
jgi:hypothetical protein